MEPDDVDVLFQWENEVNHWQVSETKFPFSRHLISKFIENGTNLEQDGQMRFVVSLINGFPIGTLDFYDVDLINQRTGIGILIDELYREKGHAKNALQIAIQYAFNNLHLTQLNASILSNNINSKKLFESVGFEPCGYRQNWVKSKEGWLHEHLYQLLNKSKL